jgi:2,3-bisphosphoglycerate-independent phosphoglycerate mutase
LQDSYDENITDEFVKPIVVVDRNNDPIATIQNDDVVIFFNFRTDRGRQLTEVLSQKDFHEYNMHKLKLHYLTMTNYDDTFKAIKVIYPKEDLTNTLGEILEKHQKKQIRIAETEKYPHVTFFFSGGREDEFKGEKRIMCPSPKVATYDLQPEMSAKDITKAIIPELKKQEADFICLNFANTDMVGHTGVMKAAIKAAETVDKCLKEVITAAQKNNYTSIIIADHGNSEVMINEDGTPNTAHTTNPVPIIVVDNDIKTVKSGILADIAPSILKLIGIKKPAVMTQKALF